MAVPVLGLPPPPLPKILIPPEAQTSKRLFSLGRRSATRKKFLTWSSPKTSRKASVLPGTPVEPVAPFMCVERIAPGVILRHSPGLPQVSSQPQTTTQPRAKDTDQWQDRQALFPVNPPPECIRRSTKRQKAEKQEGLKEQKKQEKSNSREKIVIKTPSSHSVNDVSDCDLREVLEKLDLYQPSTDSQDRPQFPSDGSSEGFAEARPLHGIGPLSYLRTMRLRFKVMRQVYRAAREAAALEEPGQVVSPRYKGRCISGPLPTTGPEQNLLRKKREEFINSQKSSRDSGYMACSLSPSIRRSSFVAQCSSSLMETPNKPPRLEAQSFSSDGADESTHASSDSEEPTKTSPWRDSMQKAVEDINAKYQEYSPGPPPMSSVPKDEDQVRPRNESSVPCIKVQGPEKPSPVARPLKSTAIPEGARDSGCLMVPDSTHLEGPELRDRIVEIMRECLEPWADSERPNTCKDEPAQQQQMCFCLALQVAGKDTSPCEKCLASSEVPYLRL